MPKPFNYSATWNDAVAMITANVQILIAVIGVFVVVPQFVLIVLMGPPPNEAVADPLAALGAYYSSNFLPLLIASIIGIIGTLTILTVYLDNSRPTVASAIAAAFGMLLTYFITNIIMAFVVGLGMILLLIPGIYLAIKFICAGAVIVAEKERNPIAALRRSWDLTNGNSLRIFGFVVILFVVLIVISTVFSLVTTVLMAGGTEGVLFWIGQLFSALFQGAATAVSLAVTAAIYRQLTGPDSNALKETFG